MGKPLTRNRRMAAALACTTAAGAGLLPILGHQSADRVWTVGGLFAGIATGIVIVLFKRPFHCQAQE